MRVFLIGLFAWGAACGGSEVSPPRSAAEHLQLAEQCEEKAAEHEFQAEAKRGEEGTGGASCLDTPAYAPDPESGGEPIALQRPCFKEPRASEFHKKEARRWHKQAEQHREEAAALMRVEREFCAGFGELELSHSPFFHREDVVGVEPYREGGELRGARIWFRALPGLSVDWLERAAHCHMARAKLMGYAPSFMPYCPLAVAEVAVSVAEDKQGFAVVVRSPKNAVAQAVLGRANDLLRAEPASESPPVQEDDCYKDASETEAAPY